MRRKTIAEKLANRRFKIPNRFFYSIYHFLGTGPLVAGKYHPKYTIRDNINDCQGPAFLIWNHQSRRDHAFLMEATYPRRLNIVAGYNEFFRGHLHTVFQMVNIIPKKNFTNDLVGVRGMNAIIRQGGVVCFSPEGSSSVNGSNQPIVAGTGRFLQFYDVPVYMVKLKGAYLTNTKVDQADRLGEVEVELFRLFSPEELKKLTPEQIDQRINQEFTFDDYAFNKKKRVRYKNNGNICHNLADLCYRCPKCGQEFTMVSDKDYIKCTACGNGATCDDYYTFHPFDEKCVIPESPTQWDNQQREVIAKEIRKNEHYAYTDYVQVGCLPKYHYIKHKQSSEYCGEGELTFDHQGIHFVGSKFGEPWTFDLSYKTIFTALQVTDLSFYCFYVGEEYFEFYPAVRSSEKVRLLVEEMHRLHFNTWKNLPSLQYLYQDDKSEK